MFTLKLIGTDHNVVAEKPVETGGIGDVNRIFHKGLPYSFCKVDCVSSIVYFMAVKPDSDAEFDAL